MTAAQPEHAEEILRNEGDEGTPELPLTAPPSAYTLMVSIVENETNATVGTASNREVHRHQLDDNGVYSAMLAELGGAAYLRAFVDGDPG